MAKTILSKPSIFEPYGHSDLYALDNLYFSALREREVWDFSRVREFSALNLGFIFARAELTWKKFQSELEIKNLSPSFKKGICLSAGWEEVPGLKIDSFLPKVLGTEEVFQYSRLEDVSEEIPFREFFSQEGFVFQGIWKDKNYLILFSNTDSENRNLPSIIQKISHFNSDKKLEGNFFLRTEKQTYLNFLKPKESLGPLFLQEKKIDQDEFLFLSLEYSESIK
ncbi:LIC11631 family protein [Leptospira koniambonensis]|uniref:LIC11631 family protein n=1 Tax=Leptospira koniambonensis TaxID=2484950 RepID=UPI003EC0BA69